VTREEIEEGLREVLEVWSGQSVWDDDEELFRKKLKMLQVSDVIFDVKDILDLMRDVLNPPVRLSDPSWVDKGEFRFVGTVWTVGGHFEYAVWTNDKGLVNITSGVDEVPLEGYKDVDYISNKMRVDPSLVRKLLNESMGGSMKDCICEKCRKPVGLVDKCCKHCGADFLQDVKIEKEYKPYVEKIKRALLKAGFKNGGNYGFYKDADDARSPMYWEYWPQNLPKPVIAELMAGHEMNPSNTGCRVSPEIIRSAAIVYEWEDENNEGV